MSDKSDTFEKLLDEVDDLVFGDLLLGNPTEMGIDQTVECWVLLHRLADMIEARKEALRKWLLDYTALNGKATDKGGQNVFIHNTMVQREQRVSKVPEEDGIRTLLEGSGIPLDKAFSKVTKVVLDPSKLEVLVGLGTLKKEDVEGLRKVVWALKVKPSRELETAIETRLGQSLPEEA